MAGRQSLCPSCGADVHPQEVECPECGYPLARRPALLPILVGVAGVLVALLAGAGVWVLLDPSGRPSAPPVQAEPQAPSEIQAASPPPVPPPAQEAAPAAPPADVADAQLPLPNVAPGTAGPQADEASRKEFARTTQENFVQNGLDMKVTAGGPQATIISMAFSFPAKTAVELIASGPFPRQCKLRGFTSITFSDPSGASWSYDLATDKLTAK